MSDTLKISGAIKVGSFASDPSGSQDGYIYYNTTDSKFKMNQGGAFKTIVDEDVIANLVATDIAYERVDGSKKNIDAASDEIESAVSDLDDAIGSLSASPTNYTPSDASIVADHLSAIDSALTTSGSTEFDDTQFKVFDNADGTKKIRFELSALSTGQERTIIAADETVNLGSISINSAKVSADGSVTSHSDVTSAGSGQIITGVERTKLNGIEDGADITDATNVAAAGATMDADTDVSANGWVLDEDNMVSDDATKVPTQQSVKAYVDNEIATNIASSKSYQGGYDAATNTPDLDSSPVAGIVKGDAYDVTVAGTFFSADVEVGDMMTARVDSPTSESDWVIVQANLTPASIKTQYESNADTNAFTDAEKTLLGNQSGTNTGDEVAATDSSAGIVELATTAETDAGSATDRAVTPGSLTNVLSDIAGKISNLVEDTTPQLGGDLDANGNAIEDASNEIVIAGQNSVRRAKQASKTSFIEEEYIHAIALAGSQTDAVISDLTFAHASIEGMEICYKLKESSSGDIKIGTIRVATNGTNVVLNDMGTETADTGVTFSADINGANVEIKYTSGTNAATMRADVKKFLV